MNPPLFSLRHTALFLLAVGLQTPAFAGPPQPAAHQTQIAVDDYDHGNFPAALTEFRTAAQKGNRLAEFNYAMMLLNGEGTTANVDEGKKWLKKAADANMSHAQYVYGRMYDDGEFVGRDPAEAHRWFLKAARQGHVQAQLALANQFLDGRGTARNFGEAFVWYKKAAAGGDMTAQYVAGSYYERGGRRGAAEFEYRPRVLRGGGGAGRPGGENQICGTVAKACQRGARVVGPATQAAIKKIALAALSAH